jgi:hypothetical protein
LPHQPPLSHTDDFNHDDESDERDKVITLDVLPPAPPPVESYRKPVSNRVLSLEAPINALSSMYGRNGGVGYIDSIGNFLPRPHTVNSPATSSSKCNYYYCSTSCSTTGRQTLFLHGICRDLLAFHYFSSCCSICFPSHGQDEPFSCCEHPQHVRWLLTTPHFAR